MAKSLLIFVPAFGQQITATTFLTTHALQQALAAKGIGGGISTLSYPDIAELRNIALTIWYDTLPATHLLFIDADMGFDPQLVLDMLMFDEPVVGTLYPRRTLPIQWAASGTGEDKAERSAGFMSVAGVGMGCTLIRRDAVTTMLEKIPSIIDTRLEMHSAYEIFKNSGIKRFIRAFDKIDDPVNGPISEDLSFCKRWRDDCGGKVWAAIGHRMQHVGPYAYEGCYLEYVMQKANENPVQDSQPESLSSEAKRLVAAE